MGIYGEHIEGAAILDPQMLMTARMKSYLAQPLTKFQLASDAALANIIGDTSAYDAAMGVNGISREEYAKIANAMARGEFGADLRSRRSGGRKLLAGMEILGDLDELFEAKGTQIIFLHCSQNDEHLIFNAHVDLSAVIVALPSTTDILFASDYTDCDYHALSERDFQMALLWMSDILRVLPDNWYFDADHNFGD